MLISSFNFQTNFNFTANKYFVNLDFNFSGGGPFQDRCRLPDADRLNNEYVLL